jgi:MinD-like ATPase involved in chromosome partitioning or flagellar assembly
MHMAARLAVSVESPSLPRIISTHSFRGGTGKSNTTANLAVLVAREGHRVGVIDTDIQSPGIHVIFQLAESSVTNALNDYLWGKCSIEDAAYDVTITAIGNADPDADRPRIFLIPSSVNVGEIGRVLKEGYDDASDKLLLVMRPDSQDFQGTAVTAELARRLDIPEILIVINKVPPSMDTVQLREHVEKTYGAEVAAMFPMNYEIVRLASSGIFVNRFPDHPMTLALKQVAKRVMD